MVFFSILASGEQLHVAGFVTPLFLPDWILGRLPFFANVRAPSRIIAFAYLFLAMGVGFAVATALRERKWIWQVAAAVVSVLIVLDFYPAHLATTPLICARGLETVRTDRSGNLGVFNLPLSYADEDNYMLDQICDHQPLVGGMIARETGSTLIDRLSFTDLARQRKQLREGHVKYVVIHRPHNGLYAWNAFLPPVSAFLRTYQTVYDDPDLMVLRVY
jgi:hypothetical protein